MRVGKLGPQLAENADPTGKLRARFKNTEIGLRISKIANIYIYIYTGAYLSPNFWGSKPKSVSQQVFCPNDFSITYAANYATSITN